MSNCPSVDQQRSIYHSSRQTKLSVSQTWFLIHRDWFEAWSSKCSLSSSPSSSSTDLTQTQTDNSSIEIGPIDNSKLLDQELGLKFGISIGIDCEIVPESLWNSLVDWYGLKDAQHAIPRRVIAPSGPGSESVEFYPPTFYFYILIPEDWNQPSRPSGSSSSSSSPPPPSSSSSSSSDQLITNPDRTKFQELSAQDSIKQSISIGHSIRDLHQLLTNQLFPNFLTRSFRLWSLHASPSDPNRLIITTSEFLSLEHQLINPPSALDADLNEALLTEPINRIAIEHQLSTDRWLIDNLIGSSTSDLHAPNPTNSNTPSSPSVDGFPSPIGFGGQDWLDRMEEMNQANSLDPKFLITSPVTPIQSQSQSIPNSIHPISSKSSNASNSTNGLDILSHLRKVTKFGSSPQSVPKPRGIRGLVGLTNLGNTCFMNSALQCMSNCPELKTYFLSRVYIDELNRTNPLGMGGKVAETFGQLIERMWSSEFEVSRNSSHNTSSSSTSISSYNNIQHQSISPREFKSIVGRFNSLFLGYGQQDSQELLTFLLDALHEDLNRVKVKPFDEIPDYDDSNSSSADPLEEAEKILKLSKICWNLYRRRNDSVIVDLFQGQYKSTLICPDCNKIAIKFDEIMYLTLQLPINKKLKGSVYFVPLDQNKPRIKVIYELNKDSTIRQLKQHIGKLLGADPDKMAAVEDWSGKPWKIWQDTDSIEGIMERDVINLFETPLPFAALKSGVYYSHDDQGEADQPTDLLIPVVSYRPAERSTLASGGSSIKPGHLAFGVFFVARISAKDRMSYQGVYTAVVREYARYTNHADDLFRVDGEDGDVEMKDDQEAQSNTPIVRSEQRPVPNLFKISVPRTPTTSFFPISNSMGNPTIGLEERIALYNPPSTTSDEDSSMSSSNGAVFETDLSEDLYEDKPKESTIPDPSNTSSTIPKPVVQEGDYFECEWSPSAMAHFFGLDKSLPNSKNWTEPPTIEDPELVASRTEEGKKKTPGVLTIEECFKDFSKPEKLGEDDKWYCPRCKNHVQATKRMQIWKVPDILVVHFKRFSSARTSYGRSTKVDAFVDFPIEGLDLLDEVESIKVIKELKRKKRKLDDQQADEAGADDPSREKIADKLADNRDSLPPEIKIQKNHHPNRDDDDDGDKNADHLPKSEDNHPNEEGDGNHDNHESEENEEEEEESLIYDLFAVDNHFGGLGGGHYTAFAKNEEDGKWHNYDDSHVSEVSSPEKVKSSAAYLLFYRRRTHRQLGLKTHGIIRRSAIQSRDISVAPSEERARSSNPATTTHDHAKSSRSVHEGSRLSKSSSDPELEPHDGRAEDDDDDDDDVNSSLGGIARVGSSDRCDSFGSSRSDLSQTSHSRRMNDGPGPGASEEDGMNVEEDEIESSRNHSSNEIPPPETSTDRGRLHSSNYGGPTNDEDDSSIQVDPPKAVEGQHAPLDRLLPPSPPPPPPPYQPSHPTSSF